MAREFHQSRRRSDDRPGRRRRRMLRYPTRDRDYRDTGDRPCDGTLYVVAKTKEGNGSATRYVQRLHALNISTGAEKLGGPVEIRATFPGDGHGS